MRYSRTRYVCLPSVYVLSDAHRASSLIWIWSSMLPLFGKVSWRHTRVLSLVSKTPRSVCPSFSPTIVASHSSFSSHTSAATYPPYSSRLPLPRAERYPSPGRICAIRVLGFTQSFVSYSAGKYDFWLSAATAATPAHSSSNGFPSACNDGGDPKYPSRAGSIEQLVMGFVRPAFAFGVRPRS